MEEMVVKQMFATVDMRPVEWEKAEEEGRKQSVKIAGGVAYVPLMWQGRALLEFLCPVGIGDTVPSFSRGVWGSVVILCPSHCSFPEFFKKAPQASIPRPPPCRELLGIRMSRAGPDQGAGIKETGCEGPRTSTRRGPPILTRTGYVSAVLAGEWKKGNVPSSPAP